MPRPITKGRYFRVTIPTCLILFMAYSEWAYSYRFCYEYVYKKSNAKYTMIAFLVIENFCLLTTLTSWLLILIVKPGKMPMQVPPYDLERFVRYGSTVGNDSINLDDDVMSSTSTMKSTYANSKLLEPPEIFECDKDGLPSWCHECGSLKLLRSHHSSITNECIPMFDHYCTFVGSTIGKQNYPYFLIFLISIESLMCFTVITVIVFSGIWNRLNAALIVFVILTGIMTILTGHLLYTTFSDLLQGDTTIERLQRLRVHRQQRKIRKSTHDPEEGIVYDAYVNIRHLEDKNLRAVVHLELSDRPYNNGLKRNCQLWLTGFQSFTSPEEIATFQSSMFSEEFKTHIYNKIEKNDYKIFGSGTKLESVTL